MSIIDKVKKAFLSNFAHIKIFPYPMFVVFDPTTYAVKGHHYYEARRLIKPGDVLLRSYEKFLDGYFIPGNYSHAAIYLGGEEEKIIHSMTPNVQYTDLCTFMRCDNFAIIRAGISDEHTQRAIDRAISKLGVPYDYDFVFEKEDSTSRHFSCSELVHYAFQLNNTETKWFIVEHDYKIIKKSLFSPDDILPKEDSTATLVYKV